MKHKPYFFQLQICVNVAGTPLSRDCACIIGQSTLKFLPQGGKALSMEEGGNQMNFFFLSLSEQGKSLWVLLFGSFFPLSLFFLFSLSDNGCLETRITSRRSIVADDRWEAPEPTYETLVTSSLLSLSLALLFFTSLLL